MGFVGDFIFSGIFFSVGDFFFSGTPDSFPREDFFFSGAAILISVQQTFISMKIESVGAAHSYSSGSGSRQHK